MCNFFLHLFSISDSYNSTAAVKCEAELKEDMSFAEEQSSPLSANNAYLTQSLTAELDSSSSASNHAQK